MNSISKCSLLLVAAFAFAPFSARGGGEFLVAPELGDANVILPKIHFLNEKEIAAGDLASVKACDPHVKAYGQKIAKDHREADADVISMAQQQKMDASKVIWGPQEGEEVLKEKAEMALIEKIHSCNFDRAFLNNVVKANEFMISELKNAVSTAILPIVQEYIANSLPTLQLDLDEANTLLKATK